MTERKRGTLFGLIIIIITSLVISLIIAFGNSVPQYKNLFILPMEFAFLCLFIIPRINKNFSNISVLIIVSLYFIRNVINPFFMYLGNYNSIFPIYSTNNINKAIFLMCYETLMVFITIIIFANREKPLVIKNISINKKHIKLNTIGFILILLSIFCLSSFLANPLIRDTYNTIFNTTNVVSTNYMTISSTIEYGTFQRVLFTLTTFLIPILQLCIPLTIFLFMKKRYGEKKGCIFIAFIIIALNFLLISNNNIDIFIITLVLCLILIKLFPKYRRVALFVIGSTLLLGMILIINAKINTDLLSSGNSLTKFFQAYFQGVNNVAGGFNIVNDNKIKSLFFDFFDMIPFRNSLFNGIAGNRLVKIYCWNNGVTAQIIPSISQAYHYLGFVFAPIIPMSITAGSIHTFKKVKSVRNFYRLSYYLLVSIYLAFATAVNNFTIFGTTFLNLLLPLFLLSLLSGKEV